MGSTCALLGPISGEMSREAIERLLGGGGVSVLVGDGWGDVFAWLAEKNTAFDVLIGDFGTPGAPAIDDVLRDYPHLSVAAVNLSGFDTHLHNIDSRLFVTFISALGLGAPSTPVWSTQLLGMPSGPRRVDDDIADLRVWLDAVLSRVLARAVGLTESRDIAGLTMDVVTARRLLGAQNAARDVAALEREIRAAEARLLLPPGSPDQPLLPLRRVEERFGLDPIERRIFWLALAPDIDDRYGRVIGVLNDDLGRRRPTPALLAAAIDGIDGEWQLLARFTGPRAFARFGLVVPDRAAADLPWPHKGLTCPPDVIETVLTGAPATPALTRIAA